MGSSVPRRSHGADSLSLPLPPCTAMSLPSALYTLEVNERGEKSRYLCKQCTKAYPYVAHGSTSNLKAHYQSKHPAALGEYQARKQQAAAADEEMSVVTTSSAFSSSASVASPPPSKRAAAAAADGDAGSSVKRAKQSTISFQPSANTVVLKQMALFFATNYIAFNVASSDTFRAFADALRFSSMPLPGREGLKTEVSKLEAEMRTELLRRLQDGKAPVAVAIDGWTNVRQTKVTNVVLLSGGNAFYWCSIANPLDRNTADWLSAELEPILQALVDKGVRFAAFIADNEAVNGALFKQLLQPFPFLVRVPCAAHTIQLVVKQVMQADRWAAVRSTVDDILRGFGASKEWRLKLAQLQQGEKRVYALVKPNDTRWNSHLYASERLLKLQSFIDCVVKQRASFWPELEEYIAFLKPFQHATDVLQRDWSSLFHVFQQWSMLTKHIASSEDAGLKQTCMAALKQRWQSQVNEDATIACALLSLDADLEALGVEAELIESARRFIISFGCAYLRFFKLTSLESDELSGRLLLQLGQFTGRRERFQTLDGQVRIAKLASQSWSALDMWALYEMELGVVARALLSMPASEAAVERTFSAQGAVHSKLRNRLGDARVQQQMFVAFNHRALSASTPVRPSCVEVGLDVSFLDMDTESECEGEEELPEEKQPAMQQLFPEAAPAAAAPLRSQSEINADNRAFLETYIRDNDVQPGQRWGAVRLTHLEAAAIGNNTGGYSTEQLVQQIKRILHERAQQAL